jgi:hypothetical protein
MLRRARLPWIDLLLLLSLAGCAHQGGWVCQRQAPELLPPEVLVAVERTLSEPTLPTPAVFDAALGRAPVNGSGYRALAEHEGQCLAARASSAANSFDLKRQQLVDQAARSHKHSKKAQELVEAQEQILYAAALEARNQEAGTAMEAYYRLAQVELQGSGLLQSFAELEDSIRQTEDLVAQGIRPPVERETLRRQREGLQYEGVQLRARIDQLNVSLRRLLGFDVNCEAFHFWPSIVWCPDYTPIDIDSAVAVGLANRPRVVLLRSLLEQLSAGNQPAVASLLSASSSLMGMGAKPPACPKLAMLLKTLSPSHKEEDLEATCRQLNQTLADNEREVSSEIRHAVIAAEAQLRLAILAREKTLSWQHDVRDLLERNQTGAASFAEISKAKLELLHAQSDYIREIMTWKLSMVAVRQAQGLLVQECGYPLADGCHPPRYLGGPLPIGVVGACSAATPGPQELSERADPVAALSGHGRQVMRPDMLPSPSTPGRQNPTPAAVSGGH